MSPEIVWITLFFKILWLNILSVSPAFTQGPYQAQTIRKKINSWGGQSGWLMDSGLPTSGLPPSGQSWGGQSWHSPEERRPNSKKKILSRLLLLLLDKLCHKKELDWKMQLLLVLTFASQQTCWRKRDCAQSYIAVLPTIAMNTTNRGILVLPDFITPAAHQLLYLFLILTQGKARRKRAPWRWGWGRLSRLGKYLPHTNKGSLP